MRARVLLAFLGTGAVASAQDTAAPQDLRSSEADYGHRGSTMLADADIDDGPQKHRGIDDLGQAQPVGEAVTTLGSTSTSTPTNQVCI